MHLSGGQKGIRMDAKINTEETVNVETDDISLLLMMGDKHNDPDSAEMALREFFRRYQAPLLFFAERSGFLALGWAPDDFVLLTFERAYHKIHLFDPPSGLPPEELGLKIKSWLFQVAKNEFLMEFRKPQRKQEAPTLEELAEEEKKAALPKKVMERFSFNQIQEKKAAVRTFLEGLPKPDRELLVISMNFYDFQARKVIIPEDILDGLADSMGTTPESIKTKRARLMRRLEEYIENTTT